MYIYLLCGFKVIPVLIVLLLATSLVLFPTSWILFLFSLCPEVFATLVSMITCKVLFINILYIYTFNYLYLKLSFLPYFAAASYCFLSPVRLAFKLFTSSLPHSIAAETSLSIPQILFLFSVFCTLSCLSSRSYMFRYSFLFRFSFFSVFTFLSS